MTKKSGISFTRYCEETTDMERTPELLKSLATVLAETAITKEGSQMVNLLRSTGFLGNPSAAGLQDSSPDDLGERNRPSSSKTPFPGRIGIWEPKQENGKTYFVRSKDLIKDWNYWSNIGRIEPKGKDLRVVYMGESVARGYLYDPQYTPAMALEGILKRQLQGHGIEVIDLARTNLGMDVRELAIAALQLEPDIAIIFSGNNWRGCFPPASSDIPCLDALLRTEGMSGPKRYAEEQLAQTIKSLVHDLATAYRSRNVPLLWIIPEFNLGDWRDPVLNAPYLPAGANMEWLSKHGAAESALQAGDLTRAWDLAQAMVCLDGGTTVAGFYILAECSRRKNDLKLARHYLELARDSVTWDSSKNASPRPYSVTQKTLREEAVKYGHQIVDLPALFTDHLNGEIPDRRLFVDYCHLTEEGIRIAMAATASCVLSELKKTAVPWQALKESAPSASAQVQAEASFLAAIHNAHWWQSYELVYHYCSRSVEFSPHIANIMKFFIDLQTRRTPMLMCKAAEQISELGSPLIRHYLLRYNNQQLDPLLLNAVIQALKKRRIEADEQLNQFRREEHSLASRSTDLLDYYYCSAGYQPQDVVWALPRRDKSVKREFNYFKAFLPESRFAFVGEADRAVGLELTCRARHQSLRDSTISIELNGEFLLQHMIGREWNTWEIIVPGNRVKNGINTISVRWPAPEFPGLEGYDGVMGDLLEGKIPEFYCCFGEIFAFRAFDARADATPEPVMQETYAVGSN